MNSFKKSERVPLSNFERSPGVPLLNFEEGPGVLLLNFRGVPGPTFKLWGGSRVPGPRVPRSRILGSCSYFYTMSGMMKFLALTLYLLARIILTLICSSAIIVCFQKVNFQRCNLLIWNFELPSAFLYALVSYSKNCLFYVKK